MSEEAQEDNHQAEPLVYKRSPAGTSAGGTVLGTPDVAAVNKAEDRTMYASRKRVYPRRVYGTFRVAKWVMMTLSLSIYYLLPFLRFDRGIGVPDQAILIDFPTRKAYFFAIEIWPQEVYYVTGLLLVAAFGLFLATALAGRVWCGYACPQTVWTDLFVHIERWIEGDRNQRLRLDKAPWTFSKIFKKIFKHICWLVVALATGGAAVFYFADAPTLFIDLFAGDAPLTSYIFIAVLAGFTYLLGGIAREQVCIYMCPWPRIQGALVDEHSYLIAYDDKRGEARGAHKKGSSWDGRGDCIDCKQCVAVCPMGIDIRDGLQMECIQCALCVDACNGIMKKVDRAPNLIRYSPARVGVGGAVNVGKSPLIRPRTVIYVVLITAILAIMISTLLNRAGLETTVIRDRNPLFVTLSSGNIRNGYSLNVINRLPHDRQIKITVTGIEGVQLRPPFSDNVTSFTATIGPDQGQDMRMFVIVPLAQWRALDISDTRAEVQFHVEALDDGEMLAKTTAFMGPKK